MSNRTLPHDSDPQTDDATDLIVERVLPDIHRVRRAGGVLGYVHESGSIYVTLLGTVYNTAVEIGQSHDLEAATDLLAAR